MSENRQLPAMQTAAPAAGLIFHPGELDEIQRVAKLMNATGCFRASDDPQTDMAIAAMKIIAGKEFGLAPFSALRGIHIIKGKPGLDYKVVGAKIKQSGRYNFKPIKTEDTVCEMQFYDSGEPVYLSRFTIADAKQAGYTNSGQYAKIPKIMLFARCLTQGATMVCPDVFNGGVVSDVDLETTNLEVTVSEAAPEDKPAAKPGVITKPQPRKQQAKQEQQAEPEPTAETESGDTVDVQAEPVDQGAPLWPAA